MNSAVPGYVPKLLQDPSVRLFRAEERVLDSRIDGWQAQMLARGLAVSTIKDRLSLLKRFQTFTNDYPWRGGPGDIDQFAAERRSGSKPLALSTLRTDSNTIGMFCGYVTNPAYGWVDFCEKTFDEIPAQIVFEWNSPQHLAGRGLGREACVEDR